MLKDKPACTRWLLSHRGEGTCCWCFPWKRGLGPLPFWPGRYLSVCCTRDDPLDAKSWHIGCQAVGMLSNWNISGKEKYKYKIMILFSLDVWQCFQYSFDIWSNFNALHIYLLLTQTACVHCTLHETFNCATIPFYGLFRKGVFDKALLTRFAFQLFA